MPRLDLPAPASPAPRSVTVHVFTRYGPRAVRVRAHVLGDRHDTQGGCVVLQLYSTRSQQGFATRTVRRLGIDEVTFDTRRVPFGCCAFRARFIDRYGVAWRTEVIQDRLPGPYPWLGSRAGLARTVPAPWTPLVVSREDEQIAVGCWGRRYVFGGRGLVAKIAAAGAELLSGPVTVQATVDGRRANWRPGELAVVAAAGDQVVLNRRSTAACGLALTARLQLDFDGMLRLDWELIADRPLRLDALTVEIPLRAAVARYLYRFPGRWGESRNVGALPAAGLRVGFHPFVWLGDEERGLSWFCQDDRDWSPVGNPAAVEVCPDGAAVRLRLHLIARPARLLPDPAAASRTAVTGRGEELGPVPPGGLVSAGLRYSMGLQATPVRPVERDAWEQRIFCISQGTEGFAPRLRVSAALLDRLVAAGVRAVVLFEHWADAEGYVRTPHTRAVRRIVDACHARGLQVLLYFGFLISDLADEWPAIGKDCLVLPKGGYPVFHYQPQPEQSAWRVCLNSLHQDLLVDGIARALDQFGADGVYLDGTEYPFACANGEHGCGHVRPGGDTGATYPLFAVRSAMRRIHAVVRARRRQGLVNVHNSTCMTIPTLGWATSYWDGEQFQGVGAGAEVSSLLPLDAFRAEFMGRQWGVPAEFLLAGAAYTFAQAWAFALLHDVPVRANAVAELDLIQRIWRAMDAFGRPQAQWLPYWRNGDLVAVRPRGGLVSLYRHPRHGVLAVVSNLGAESTTVRWRLDLAALGLDGGDGPQAMDVLSGEPIALRGGAAAVALEPLGWRLVHVGTEAMLARVGLPADWAGGRDGALAAGRAPERAARRRKPPAARATS